MASGFSVAQKGANATLGYTDSSGWHSATVRVKSLSYNYGVGSDESHAREERAFYPHRRVQGQFSLTIDLLGYKEFKQIMMWLHAYADTLLTNAETNTSAVTLMDVQVPSRHFHKIGVLTTGIDDHDQVGSMVFSPELVFLALSDPADPSISLTATRSTFISPHVDANATLAFYPVSVANYKDSLLYDDLKAVDPNAAVMAAINPAAGVNNGNKQQALIDQGLL